MSVVTYTCFDGELVEENRDGTILDYVPDSLGSIIMWVDETGLPAGYTPYWPYGEPWQEPEVECPFQFVGKYGYYRDLSGTYVRAREYAPEEGRWMTVDPLWPEESPYVYCLSSPTSFVDPSGMGCRTVLDLTFKLWPTNPRKSHIVCEICVGCWYCYTKCKTFLTKQDKNILLGLVGGGCVVACLGLLGEGILPGLLCEAICAIGIVFILNCEKGNGDSCFHTITPCTSSVPLPASCCTGYGT